MGIADQFEVNEYITLKLEGNESVIYIKGERFRQCKKLIVEVPIKEITSFDNLKSIDDITKGQLIDETNYKLSSNAEFWGHCSNLQVWSEHHYNTRLLHSSLAFPLLKELYKKGDPTAKRRFKEEILRRYLNGNEGVREFLYNEEYLTYLSVEELIIGLLKPNEADIMMEIISTTNNKYKMAQFLDEDEVRERISLTNLYFSENDGYIKELEINLNKFNYALPSILSRLEKLKSLRLFADNREEVVMKFCKLESLECLEIKIDGTIIIPDKFENFPNLFALIIYGNNGSKFGNVPESIGSLTNLGWLDIRSIPLEELPKSIVKLENLEWLNLSFTDLEEIPKELFDLESLQHISFDGNPINKNTEA